MGEHRKLLMIPGPVEVSPAVREAHDGPPPGHQAPELVEAFGQLLERMRILWKAPAGAQPFVVAGSGTLAMEMAAANLFEPGERALVVDTGYFSGRMAEILRRVGAEVTVEAAEPGRAVALEAVEAALDRVQPKAVFVTHVDTSTGVRMNAQAVGALARARGALTVVDGVCATAAEALSMEDGSIDLHLTGSQKALGLPAGLALFVASARAMEVRRRRRSGPPPLYLDFASWLPIMEAYEARQKSYFATPATNLVQAAAVGTREIVEDRFEGVDGVDARVARHGHVACAFEAAWQVYGLRHLAEVPEARGHTLSALRYPEGIGPELLGHVAVHGVTVAGGLYPRLKGDYFRVGHMGWCTTQGDILERTVEAVGQGLCAAGHAVDVDAARAAFRGTFDA